ncbi:hypothetical protein [Haladaptatus sp. DYF46]|uniref:hypothetical protein n=1 Tax=Haladaptatus sp. DYF46 TaxID=2886041 RepID=UPI001E48E9E9|nr:hypothetical protein [Haladaptatus sp. DYF46]
MERGVSVRSAVARTVRQRHLSRGSSEDEPRRVNARGRPPVPVADARESQHPTLRGHEDERRYRDGNVVEKSRKRPEPTRSRVSLDSVESKKTPAAAGSGVRLTRRAWV